MSILDWGIAGAPYEGQLQSGDRALVVTFEQGALVALIDGLGHGHDAAAAADAAIAVLEADPTAPVEELIARCHEQLRKTRGAVISLASFSAARAMMTWLGVGNVEGILVRAEAAGRAAEAIPARGGTVGYMLPPLNPRTLPIIPGDTLVFASDGIRHGFKPEIIAMHSPQQIADDIMLRHRKHSDDSCVVVARYLGEPSTGTRIDIQGEADVSQARIRTRDVAHGLGFESTAVEALATAVSELARNIFVHAKRGEIELAAARENGRSGIVIIARDRGPGIRDIGLAMQDGFSTDRSLGLGLPGARRLVDELELESKPGAGTTVTLRKWLR
ncbi:MAG: stage sporulation protein [Myxococcales bacterium]|nr:stage sporulation protein [Myxococcales bacterium]